MKKNIKVVHDTSNKKYNRALEAEFNSNNDAILSQVPNISQEDKVKAIVDKF